MSRFLLLICVLPLLFSCGSSSDTKIDPETIDAKITVSQRDFYLEEATSEISLKVSSNVVFGVLISAEAKSWITWTVSESKSDSLYFKIAKNTSADDRKGYIILSAPEYSFRDTIVVSQCGTASLILSAKSIDMACEAGQSIVALRRNRTYTVGMSEAASGWLSYMGTRAVVTDSLVFSVTENASVLTRSSKIWVTCEDGASDTLTLIQQGMSSTLSLVNDTIVVQAEAADTVVSLRHNAIYSVEIPTDAQSWISYAGTRAMETDKLVFSIAENLKTESRMARVRIYNEKSSDTLLIAQAAVIPQYTLQEYAVPDRSAIPAFPGAEGHGRFVTGGLGGTVYHVTSLADDGSAGTLRSILSKSGDKIVVFDVSGTIHLTSQLRTQKDNLTIAGQTSPGGICIADYPFVINTNNVQIRYVRFRPGDVSGEEPDGLGGMDKSNIMVDHCSVSWSVDECLSVYGMKNMTVQWCIASEALRVSTHGKGTHCYGGNWGGTNVSYHHNLIAHCESRTPRLGPRPSTQENEYVDIRNNVFYNWGGEGCYGGEGQHVNIVNNYYKPGPATDKASSACKYRIAKIGIRTTEYVTKYTDFAPMKHIWGKFYIDGNTVDGNTAVSADNWTNGVLAQQSDGSGVDYLWTAVTQDTIRLTSPLDDGGITTYSAAMAYNQVLDYVGCSIYRDAIDNRIIDDTRNRAATFTASGNSPGYINTQTDVMIAGQKDPWDVLSLDITRSTVDTDGDGIPDVWEKKVGLNYEDKSDGFKYNLSPLYTNLEVYMNSLVESTFPN